MFRQRGKGLKLTESPAPDSYSVKNDAPLVEMLRAYLRITPRSQGLTRMQVSQNLYLLCYGVRFSKHQYVPIAAVSVFRGKP